VKGARVPRNRCSVAVETGREMIPVKRSLGEYSGV
jgi:hypothetical protein